MHFFLICGFIRAFTQSEHLTSVGFTSRIRKIIAAGATFVVLESRGVACSVLARHYQSFACYMVLESLIVYEEFFSTIDVVKEEIVDEVEQFVLVRVLEVLETLVEMDELSPFHQLLLAFISYYLLIFSQDKPHFS